jgi:hypothetical protein
MRLGSEDRSRHRDTYFKGRFDRNWQMMEGVEWDKLELIFLVHPSCIQPNFLIAGM